MKHNEKRDILVKKHRLEWLKTRHEVFNELSSNQTLICCCGRLATSLHEYNCTRFNHKVDAETIKRLRHLLQNEI